MGPSIFSYNKTIHSYIYLGGIILLAMSLPGSEFLVSVAELVISANWLIEGRYREKLRMFKENKGLWFLLGAYIVHILWLINTSDFNYAFADLRVKMPMFVLPVIIATSPVFTCKQTRYILSSFLFGVILATVICTIVFMGWTNHVVNDIRDISIFISHIRFSLLIDIGIFILIYYVYKNLRKIKLIAIAGLLLTALWLGIFLLILQSLTGLIILFVTASFLLLRYHRLIAKKMVRYSLFLIFALPVLFLLFIYQSYERFYEGSDRSTNHLEQFTSRGTPYHHDLTNQQLENGTYVGLYICEDELRPEWDKKSSLSYDGVDLKGQEIKYTLQRYLTALDYRKDAEGLAKLSTDDIKNIENGIPNPMYLHHFDPYVIIYKILWQIHEYKRSGNPTGHSVTQRIEHLHAARNIIVESPFLGVGTGDVNREILKQYDKMNSPLPTENRLRAHNQLITFMVSFGLIGFVVMLFAFVFPIVLRKGPKHYFFVMFLVIGALSMLNEDTLESQTGVTFFMFFYCLFLWGIEKEDSIEGTIKSNHKK